MLSALFGSRPRDVFGEDNKKPNNFNVDSIKSHPTPITKPVSLSQPKQVVTLSNSPIKSKGIQNPEVIEKYRPLFVACQEGNVNSLEVLINNQRGYISDTTKSFVNVVLDKLENTPLHIAGRKGHLEVIKLLISLGTDTTKKNKLGQSPIHLILKNDFDNLEEIVLYWIEKRAEDMKLVDYEGKTPLHYICMQGHAHLLELTFDAIKERGWAGLILKPDNKGNTPLMLAYIHNKSKVVKKCFQLDLRLSQEELKGLSKYLSTVGPKEQETLQTLINEFIQLYVEQCQTLSPFPKLSSSLQKSLNSPVTLAEKDKPEYWIDYRSLKLEEEIGQGSFGKVFRGKWQQYTDVAIKQLNAEKFSSQALIELQEEAKKMSGLRHPNIVTFYGISEDENNQYRYSLVMEYADEKSLHHVLHGQRSLHWPQLLHIAQGVAKGIGYLHSKNIVHRDLKSLNILMGSQLEAKISDFGLSKVRKDSELYSVCSKQDTGTLQWKAPELFDFLKGECTKESDIFSYGMILWELCTRKNPYEEKQYSHISTYVAQGGREEIPKETPIAFAELIKHCWAQAPEKRPTVPEILYKLEKMASSPEFSI